MNSRLNTLKKESPEALSNPDIVSLASEGDRLHNIKVLAQSEGGKTLVSLLAEDIIGSLQRLMGMYKIGTRDDIVSVLAGIEAQFNVAHLLVTSEDTLKYLDSELAEALRE